MSKDNQLLANLTKFQAKHNRYIDTSDKFYLLSRYESSDGRMHRPRTSFHFITPLSARNRPPGRFFLTTHQVGECVPFTSAPTRAVSSRTTHQARPRHVPRSSLPSDIRDRRGAKHQPYTRVPRSARGLERALASLLARQLDDFDRVRDYEPTEFETDLVGSPKSGKRHVVPDFHLRNFWPDLDLYIEVTQGNEITVAQKESKARGAMRVARARDHSLVILVFHRCIIEQLLAGSLDLYTAVEKGLAELGELVPSTSIH
jgi:hypothetical protein